MSASRSARRRARPSTPCQCTHGPADICLGRATIRVTHDCDNPRCRDNGQHTVLLCTECVTRMMREDRPGVPSVRAM